MTEQRVIPMLAYEDAGRAADWITKIFGFKEIERRGTIDQNVFVLVPDVVKVAFQDRFAVVGAYQVKIDADQVFIGSD